MNLRELIHNEFAIIDDDNPPYSPLEGRNRNDLAALMAKAEFKVGAEIGVWNGSYSRVLLKTIPNLKLYCVDSWCGYNQERFFTDQEMETVYADAKHNLSRYNAEIMRMSSAKAAELIENNSLDFVYIDACHYFDEVMVDIILWAPKVKPGGIVSGHDFKSLYKCGVTDAVYAYVRAHKIYEWYTTLEDIPSWFWIAK